MEMSSNAIFKTGQIVLTPGASRLNNLKPTFIQNSIGRHISGDWGICSDPEINNEALDPRRPDQILSVYKEEEDTIWIITEHNRSVTTILLPSEY